jgi:hypothetical protein
MGRPPGRPRTTPAAPPEPSAVDNGSTPELEAPLEPEELAAEALEDLTTPLTPEVAQALNQMWRDVAHYDDEGSRTLKRRIEGRFRRATHTELHPGCSRVTVDVRMLPNKQFVRINERVYFGTLELWECEARTILALEHAARMVEAQRMDDRRSEHPTIDLDSPLAERARAIQRA